MRTPIHLIAPQERMDERMTHIEERQDQQQQPARQGQRQRRTSHISQEFIYLYTYCDDGYFQQYPEY